MLTGLFCRLTGVPASVTQALGNPSAISVLESQIIVSGFPSWYTALPSEAQSYVLAAPALYASIYPQISSLEVAAGLTTVSGLGGTGVIPGGPIQTSASTGGSNSTSNSSGTTGSSTTTKATTTTGSTASGASTTTSGSSSSSSAGVAPTNAPLVAGVMGAVGFLGLALAL